MQFIALCKIEIRLRDRYAIPKLPLFAEPLRVVINKDLRKRILQAKRLKIIRIMKLTAVLVLISCLHVSANVTSQTVSYTGKNIPLKTVLNSIKAQTGYNIAGDGKIWENSPVVSIDARNEYLTKFLDRLFLDTNIKYSIRRKTIFLSLKSQVSLEREVEKIVPIISIPVMEIRGRVTDTTGAPLEGVSVIERGTNNGTTTNQEGVFVLTVANGNAELIISRVGYTDLIVSVNNRSILNITLAGKETIGEEIVIIGYGADRRSNLSTSVSSVNAEKIENRQVVDLGKALKGQASGVLVRESSGKPGSSPKIRIRGVASLSASSAPLIVLDGLPGVNISDVNSDDVESIEILKDAASAAIYGSRGSNGVIIITTKKGKKGSPNISFNSFYGMQKVEKVDKKMSGEKLLQYYIDAKNNAWIDRGGSASDNNDVRPGVTYDIDPYWTSGEVKFYDPYDYYFRVAPIQSYSLSVNGGNSNTQYFLSGLYFSQDGILKSTDYKRYSFRSNLNVDLGRAKLQFGLSPSYSVGNDPNSEGRFGIINGMRYPSPIYPLNTGVYGQPQDDVPTGNFGTFPADLAASWNALHNLKNQNIRKTINANLSMSLQILRGLEFFVMGGSSYGNSEDKVYKNRAFMNGANPSGSNTMSQNLSLVGESYISYQNKIDFHNFKIMFGSTAQQTQNQSSYIEGSDFSNDVIQTLNAASQIVSANTFESEWSLLSYFSRANYDYKNKYLLSASIRRDGSSRFGPNRKWGLFPSISVAWKINEEGFMKGISDINLLKVRMSYGSTGNHQIGNYSWQSNLQRANYILGTSETPVIGYYSSNIANPQLSWEQTNAFDVGLDITYKHRFSATFDYYDKTTNGLLLNIPIPTMTGYATSLENRGQLKNTGYEIQLGSKILTKMFRWNSDINFSYNQNKVIKLGPDNTPIYTGENYAINTQITKVGYPIGSFYLFKQIGIYDTQEQINAGPSYPGSKPGSRIIENINKDGVINMDDRQILGQPQPKFYWGFQNNFEYKNFDLNLLLTGEGGHHIYYGFARFNMSLQFLNGQADYVKDYWKSPDDRGDGKTPRPSTTPTGAQIQPNSTWLFRGDNWRLKNLTLGYTFKGKALNRAGIEKIRPYFTSENLFFHDNFPGFNPESDTNDRNTGSVLQEGWDSGAYPNSKSYTIGINITF